MVGEPRNGGPSPTAEALRVRRYHTRNRTGCSTCRRRHVRCDEKRPSCSNCLVGQRACEYPPMEPTLRERRSHNRTLPGQQQPWAVHEAHGSLSFSVSQLTRHAAGDPFDALAVQMPLKSQELFHYLTDGTRSWNSPCPKGKRPSGFDAVVHDPYALRSTLIIAGLHYAWNTGNLQSFEPTFLFHKVESIRTVNDWMQTRDAAQAAVAVRQVLTLGFAECCLGNLPAAESHLHGLMALLDIADPVGGGRIGEDEVDRELADRYLILCQNFLHGKKSRFGKPRPRTTSNNSSPRPGTGTEEDTENSAVMDRMRAAHQTEPGGIDNQLKSLTKFPHFFAPPPRGRKPVDIDAASVVEILRDITRYIDGAASHFGRWDDPEDFFVQGAPTRLFMHVIDLHVLSFSGKVEKKTTTPYDENGSPPNFTSSWSGISITLGLYLHTVLGVWNAGRPMSSRLLCRLVQILKRHLVRDRQRLGGKGGLDKGFWFWKAFTAAVSLASARGYAAGYASSSRSSPSSSSWSSAASASSPDSARTASAEEVCRGIEDVEVLEEWFALAIKKWSKTANVKTWPEARAVLSSVVWPDNCSSEPLAMSVWGRVMALEGN
ncbi:hypothetical protein GE09DRAFT_1208189 [Coniochaeta sp. 2T2.1]|nr:hypothetical protein GE09DRAFT_1208189 [Coniochaeta sp. 2T2.1]